MNECYLKNKIVDYYGIKTGHKDYDEYKIDNVDKVLVENTAKVFSLFDRFDIDVSNDNKCFYGVNITVNLKNDAVNCLFYSIKTISIYQTFAGLDYDRKYNTRDEVYELVIFPNNSVYYCLNRKKSNEHLIPLVFSMIKPKMLSNPFFKEFLILMLHSFGEEYNIFNQISKYYEQDFLFILPVNIQDVYQYNSFEELFLGKYKTAQQVPNSWNMKDANLSYMILKVWNYVVPEQRDNLLQMVSMSYKLLVKCTKGNLQDKIIEFLYNYLDNQFRLCDKNYNSVRDEDCVREYVRICLQTHIKVDISYKQFADMNAGRIEIWHKCYVKCTPTIKIKKDTKFAELRKILPNDFKWIKTKKQLCGNPAIYANGHMQCLARDINNDECQVYSYINSSGQSFILQFEISYNKKRYKCVLVHGNGNRVDESIVATSVRDILNNYYKK